METRKCKTCERPFQPRTFNNLWCVLCAYRHSVEAKADRERKKRQKYEVYDKVGATERIQEALEKREVFHREWYLEYGEYLLCSF